MADDSAQWAAATAREWASGNHHRDSSHVPEWAGEIGDPEIRDLLISAEQAWARMWESGELPDDAPKRFIETPKGQRMLRASAGRTFNIAVSQGDSARLSHFSGAPDEEADISGYKAIKELEKRMDKPDQPIQIYLWGKQGAGKTDFALFLAQMRDDLLEDAEVGSNIRSLREADRWISSFPQLMDWMSTCSHDGCEEELEEWNPRCSDHGRPDPRLMILDEASSHTSGRGKDGYEAASKLGPMVYKIRKYRGSLILIGHDGKDVHPIVRTLADCVNKEDKKTATFYESVDDREGKHELEPGTVTGIPQTDWTYDTLEATSWSWGWDDDDRMDELEELAEQRGQEMREDALLETARNLRESGESYRDIAESIPWSKDTVRRKLQSET